LGEERKNNNKKRLRLREGVESESENESENGGRKKTLAKKKTIFLLFHLEVVGAHALKFLVGEGCNDAGAASGAGAGAGGVPVEAAAGRGHDGAVAAATSSSLTMLRRHRRCPRRHLRRLPAAGPGRRRPRSAARRAQRQHPHAFLCVSNWRKTLSVATKAKAKARKRERARGGSRKKRTNRKKRKNEKI